MIFKKMGTGLISVGAITALAACGNSGEETVVSEENPIQVVATIAQIGEPLAEIGGELVEVETVMVLVLTHMCMNRRKVIFSCFKMRM